MGGICADPPRERLTFHLGTPAKPRHGRHLRQLQQKATAARGNPGPPFCVVGLWLVSRQMSATQPTSFGPIGAGKTNVRHPANKLWAYRCRQDKSPPPSQQALGLQAEARQMSATQPTSFGPTGAGKTNVRQAACRSWAYGLFQDKCPPSCLPALGLWLVAGQMSATQPTSFGPTGGRTKVRQIACKLWAYRRRQDKCPPNFPSATQPTSFGPAGGGSAGYSRGGSCSRREAFVWTM